MTPEQAAALRKPFDKKSIGKLPKKNKDGTTVYLDFAGHAAVTDRLLQIDPAWSWEPLAYDDLGLPAYDRTGGLWIRLTLCGISMLGYGDGPDPKQRIGDAIRNAAMRRGVALDLWSRQELEGLDPNGGDAASAPVRTVEDFTAKHGELNQYGQPVGFFDDPKRATRSKGQPQAEAWPAVAEVPASSDAKWIKQWKQRVTDCITRDEITALWPEVTAKHAARELTDEDGVALREFAKEAAEVLDLAEARLMAEQEATGELPPSEVAS